jgi:hypothetical protein
MGEVFATPAMLIAIPTDCDARLHPAWQSDGEKKFEAHLHEPQDRTPDAGEE